MVLEKDLSVVVVAERQMEIYPCGTQTVEPRKGGFIVFAPAYPEREIAKHHHACRARIHGKNLVYSALEKGILVGRLDDVSRADAGTGKVLKSETDTGRDKNKFDGEHNDG